MKPKTMLELMLEIGPLNDKIKIPSPTRTMRAGNLFVPDPPDLPEDCNLPSDKIYFDQWQLVGKVTIH